MRQISLFLVAAVLMALTALTGARQALAEVTAVQAELPRHFVDTAYTSPDGDVIEVAAGEDLQAALERARPGDVIELEAGAVFEGPFDLPDKEGAEDWIVVRSSRLDELPEEGERVGPEHAELMPKLVAISGSVLRTEPGAHHYRFIGIEAYPDSGEGAVRGALRSLQGVATRNAGIGDEGIFLYNLIELGSGNETTLEALPHHIIIDRCYLHGDPSAGTRRGIAMNGRHMAVIDSHLADFKEQGADSQAILGWNGPGPFKIVNNYLEGAGENVMFGGAEVKVEDLVPSDIEIRHNHFYKPLAWREGDPSYEGKAWTVKNLFELKNARRVLVEGNLMEHNWPHGQNGFAVLFTVRNEQGAVPWAKVQDVTFTNNVLRGVGAGFNVLGHDDNPHPSGQTTRIVIRNNLFEDMGGDWGDGTFLQFLEGVGEIWVDGNTVLNSGRITNNDGEAHDRFVFTNNIINHNRYGMIGSGQGPGRPTLKHYFESVTLEGNVMIGGRMSDYPGDNAFPASPEEVGFRDPEGDYRLSADSPFPRAGSGGPGVDFQALCAALAPTERLSQCPAVKDGGQRE